MKKIFFFLMATIGLLFASCSNDEEKDWISVDYSKDLVGIWTTIEGGYAEALVIDANGNILSTGVNKLDYWEDVKGKVTLNNNKMTMTFEDNDNFEGRFEIIPGETLVLVDEKNGERDVYRYCAKNITDELQGTWASLTTFYSSENEVFFYNYNEDGHMYYTCLYDDEDTLIASTPAPYKVIGDLVFEYYEMYEEDSLANPYMATRMNIESRRNSELRDVLTMNYSFCYGEDLIEGSSAYYRLMDELNVVGRTYDYEKSHVTNVEGTNEDFDLMGYTFNFSKIDNAMFKDMLMGVKFSVEFPSEDSIQFNCRYNGVPMNMKAPIEVGGRTMTVKMSERNAAYRDVELFAIQDAYDTKFRMIMKREAFVNFFTNMCIAIMAKEGKLDKNDKEAVDSYFTRIDGAIDCINVGFVMNR